MAAAMTARWCGGNEVEQVGRRSCPGPNRRRGMIRLLKGRDGIVGIAGFSLLGLVVVFMALGGLLLLTGCGEEVAEKVAEKAVEKAAEDGGGDVDVDIGSDGDSGSISIKDGDSEIEMGGATDAPEGFPEELVHPEGKIMMSQKRTVDGSVEMFVQSSVNSEPTEVNEYYESAVDDLGFTVEEGSKMKLEQGETIIFSFSAVKGEETISIQTSGGGSAGEDGVQVTIMYGYLE